MQQLTIFKATLRLIREGRFGMASMAEIAYHAHVTAITVETLFETRDKLISALSEYVYNELNTIIRVALGSKAPFDEKFFRLWEALFSYYVDNPDVGVFVDRCTGSPSCTDALRSHQKNNHAFLASFFAESGLPHTAVTPEMMATIFHQNIRVAARNGNNENRDMSNALAQIIFEGFRSENESSPRPLEAA